MADQACRGSPLGNKQEGGHEEGNGNQVLLEPSLCTLDKAVGGGLG